MFQFFQDELENMDESNDEYQYQKDVYIDLREKTRFWPYCSNDKFIKIIEETICKPITDKESVPDRLETIVTQNMECLSNEEYKIFTRLKDRQKSRQNEVGLFNQDILGACDGWESAKSGIDLYNKKKNIYVELKNRYNTLNSSSKAHTCKKLQQLSQNATCYLAHVIPKKDPFTKYNKKYNITEICGDDLFKLVTGSSIAKYELETAVKDYMLYRKIKMKRFK